MNKGKRKVAFLLLGIVFLTIFTGVAHVKASAGSVTGYQKITWGISAGRYYVNGTHAFCAQYNKKSPPVGTTVTEIVPCTNEIIRKALYYGYNGPQNTLGTDAKAHVLTAIAVSDANIGESATGASAKYDAFYWDLVNNSGNYPSPPTNFKAFMAITSSDNMQNLAFYEMAKNGYVKGIKTSSNTQLNSDNPCYSLAGAEYGIYANDSLAESARVGTLTTDVNGNTNTLELPEGVYYVRENIAPKGYAKSQEIIQFYVTSEQTITLNFSDVPQNNPIDILVQKVDAETKENKPQGGASLRGALFEVCYYAGLWQKDVDPSTLGETPKRIWTFATDEDGLVKYDSKYQVSGDELYDSMPLGTLVIREVKASEGYLKNDTVYVRQITSEGEEEHVNTYVCPIVPEQVIEVRVKKYQVDTEVAIPGTVFEHTTPNEDKKLVTTDDNGEIVLKGLGYGEHTLREIFVMDGYGLSDVVYTFTVDENTNDHIELVIYNNPAPYQLVISKCDTDKNKLAGAEFAIYEDAECKIEVKKGITDKDGMLYFDGLEVEKKYYLKETKAPAGYEIKKDENGEVHVYEICATSTPAMDEFACFVDGKEYENIHGTKANREVMIELENNKVYVPPQLESPKTGDMSSTGTYVVIGIISLIFLVIISCHNRFTCDTMTGKYSKNGGQKQWE